jgi:hypothetical protein
LAITTLIQALNGKPLLKNLKHKQSHFKEY